MSPRCREPATTTFLAQQPSGSAAFPEAAQLIRTARVVNDSKPQWVLSKVREACDGVERPVIAALGLAFKADIDDLRESPALAIAAQLPSEIPGSTVLAVEPNVQESPASLDGTGVILSSLEEALERADVLVLLVDHREFIGIDRSVISGKRVVDTRGVWR